jgi:hypothetical protein
VLGITAIIAGKLDRTSSIDVTTTHRKNLGLVHIDDKATSFAKTTSYVFAQSSSIRHSLVYKAREVADILIQASYLARDWESEKKN